MYEPECFVVVELEDVAEHEEGGEEYEEECDGDGGDVFECSYEGGGYGEDGVECESDESECGVFFVDCEEDDGEW